MKLHPQFHPGRTESVSLPQPHLRSVRRGSREGVAGEGDASKVAQHGGTKRRGVRLDVHQIQAKNNA